MDKNLVAVLAVALLTWGGVFFYVLRLERMARGLEREIANLSTRSADAAPETPARPIVNL